MNNLFISFTKMNFKLTTILSFAIITVVLLAGCSKSPDKALPRKNGKWTYTLTGSETTGGIQNNYTDAGTMTFTSGGSGILQSNSSTSSETFTWTYNESDKKITIASSSGSVVYDVTDAQRESEKWHRNTVTSNAGIETVTIEDITLIKQ